MCFAIRLKQNYTILLRRKCSLKVRFKKAEVVKKVFLMMYNFKEHVKIVKIYMVNFNVTIFNRLKLMGFL